MGVPDHQELLHAYFGVALHNHGYLKRGIFQALAMINDPFFDDPRKDVI